jgi:hypothetical protein
MEITKKDCLDKKNEGLTQKEIAIFYNTNPSIISKLLNNKIKKCRIGIKSEIKINEYFPIWEICPDFYEIIKRITRKYSWKYDSDYLHDRLMDYWTTRKKDHTIIQKLKTSLSPNLFWTISVQYIRSSSFRKTTSWKNNKMEEYNDNI